MEHIDHTAEALRLIDKTLMEEGQILDALRKVVEQNGMAETDSNRLAVANHDALTLDKPRWDVV